VILNALVEKLKRRAKGDFKGRHYEAALILQAVSWYLRYPLSWTLAILGREACGLGEAVEDVSRDFDAVLVLP
jgi:hypothetical protein